jgi:carbamoyl-phosphate synthase large subunit
VPKRTDLRAILILGSGPIRIGQACEFDYSGAQACRVLRREGYRVVLVNSNPATIMTDPEWADATYLEPLDAETVAQVIEREQPDAILPTLGGQTALNLAVELAPLGVELIGADLDAINRAEDRELFRETVHAAGIATPRSIVAHAPDADFPVPAIVRPAFTLGGTGGGVAFSQSDLRKQIARGIELSPIGQVLVEEYLAGWQEHELEVMCDARGNAVVVCSIENLDPMGVHTGDSWTIAPQQTLPDRVYQQLRDAAFATARAVGVATGGANVQFAVSPDAREFRVIEMNPRVSRSSALASKATGFPIAKLAALLAVGYTLDELPNDITGKTTAAFEPALDYVAVKAPRFDFEKFPLAERRLGAEMRAVGEALGLGRTFAEAFWKAFVGREAAPIEAPKDDDELLARAAQTLPERWDLLLECARRGLEPPGIHPYFAARLAELPPARKGKAARFAVDSCAGEFEARTPYYYVTHEGDDEGPAPSGRSVIVLGAGPNRIGQAIEFDYCCVHATQALHKLGYEAVLVNSNPETVSTDYDTSDRLYLEPLVEETVLDVCALEQPAGVAVSFGGQTPLRLAHAIAAAGYPLLGDPLDAIDAAEHRGRFAALAGDLAPEWGEAATADEAREIAGRIGYPVLVRPHYVISGRGMHVAHSADELRVQGPCLVDRYLEGALELDVDALCDGEGAWVAAVLEQVEPVGVHSGDSACVLPGPSVSEQLEAEIRDVAGRIAGGLGARGLINLQLAVHHNRLYVLEANPRASRTVPFVAKATRVPLVEHAVRLLLGEPLAALGLPERVRPTRAWAKEAVFAAERFPGAATRGPEMRSTGEVMAGGGSPREAYHRALRAAGRSRRGGTVGPPLQLA